MSDGAVDTNGSFDKHPSGLPRGVWVWRLLVRAPEPIRPPTGHVAVPQGLQLVGAGLDRLSGGIPGSGVVYGSCACGRRPAADNTSTVNMATAARFRVAPLRKGSESR